MNDKTIDQEFLEKCFLVCAEIGTGSSVHIGCEKIGIQFRDFYALIRKSSDLEQNYARAREARSDVRFDRLDELMKRVENREVLPDVARVLLDAIKWQCGKEKPKKYGDNQQINHSGTIQHETLVIQRTPKTIDHDPALKALPVIDIDNVK